MSTSPTFGRRDPSALRPAPAAVAYAAPVRRAVAVEPDAEETAAPDKGPYLTVGLLTLLALIFIFEQTGGLPVGPGMAFTHAALVAAGGMSRDLVAGQGEWWRIFTAPLLHANLAHIIGNGVVMAFAAITLERLIGRAWLAATFVVSALGGAIGSLLLNNSQTVTVGASGAIMGLLAMVLVCSLHFAAHKHAARLRWIAFRLFIPSLIPFGAAAGSSTDYNCHLGGAVAGGLMGFVLLVAWPEDEDRPRLGALAAGVGLTGLAAALAAFALIAAHHAAYIARGAPLAPEFLLPAKGGGTPEQVRDLVARYPHDPRVRLYSAHTFIEANNPIGAERELRLGLAEEAILEHDTPPAVRQSLRYLLVAVLLQQRREGEARRVAAPLCAEKALLPSLETVRRALAHDGFCPD